jgi:ribosomal protein L37E
MVWGKFLLWVYSEGDRAMTEKTVTLEDQKKYRANFTDENSKFFLVYCAACGKENYAMMVSSGICAMCGWGSKEE